LISIQALFLRGERLLRSLPDTDPALEARLLLFKAAGLTEREFVTRPDRPVSARVERRFLKLVGSRLSRVPLVYLTGEKEFWSVSFSVSPGVFIPRPETELLVEKAIELSPKRGGLIVDIGTGSGNIAISLAKSLPSAKVVAVDISRRALKTARGNAERQGVKNLTFVLGDLFAGLRRLRLQSRVDLLVSNPPYVALTEWQELEPEVREFEPKRALVPGVTGLEFIRRLIKGGPDFLKPGGFLVFEIGFGQSGRIPALLGPGWTDVSIRPDLSGIPRVVVARKA